MMPQMRPLIKTIKNMADDDEIDVLGEFSFNSCLAQNNQGIPSCSSREDTVHPQWLLDSTVTNWYDTEREKRAKLGPSRKLSGNSAMLKHQRVRHSSWNQAERDLLSKEMAKYGRNFYKISQTLKTKSAAEIQALIEAEYGVNLETPVMGLVKNEEQDDVPNVVQEEIVTDDSGISNVLSLVTTGSPTITVPKKHPFRKKNNNMNPKSLLKPDALLKSEIIVNPSEIYYEDELIIGSTESLGSDLDSMDIVAKSKAKHQKEKVKAVKKIGNHRRKVSKNFDKGKVKTSSKELLKSPQERREDFVPEESTKSPQLQIVLGSGQALPVSEGEQVIKIEKKKDSESDSDIEIDIDSDTERPQKRESVRMGAVSTAPEEEAPIAVPLTNLGTLPKRQKKINLLDGGGYTIAHTAAGDVLQRGREPRPRPRPAPRPRAERLIPCRMYNAEHPAPYSVRLCVSALVAMEAQAHSSRAEVMGLLGGRLRAPAPASSARGREAGAGPPGAGAGPPGAGAGPPVLELRAYAPARAAAGATHCDMDPVSQAAAGARLQALGLRVVGWHHSHPRFPAAPSVLDLRSQRALQAALQPFLALITSQHWPAGRTASQYRCFLVEEPEEGEGEPTGYQLRVRLQPDVTLESAPALLAALRELLRDPHHRDPHRVRMDTDVCPQAKLTYLEKCISSVSHHLRAAGYPEEAPVFRQLVEGIRDIFR